jgi:2-methylaconitate cis-trans-isomerase PrpF
MKKILMILAFSLVSAMGETNYEAEENLSQKERFEMLFEKTAIHFHEIRKTRKSRTARNVREVKSTRLISKVLRLTRAEKYKLLFGNTLRATRVARTARLIFPRQTRHSLYVSLNY